MIALSSLKKGSQGTVAVLGTEDAITINRLLAMGVSPGMPILLEQKFPAYIIKIGRTRAVVDHEIAENIYVRC
jgi:ferrous iron transport protein A